MLRQDAGKQKLAQGIVRHSSWRLMGTMVFIVSNAAGSAVYVVVSWKKQVWVY